jgi:ABC-type Mn2+/Zn2+ transport system permease subunit
VIDSFVESWPLFHNAYAAGWLMAVVLALVGVLVVAREQIFIGAAVSNASMLGITAGMWLETLPSLATLSWMHSESFHTFCGSVFAVLGAAITARAADTHRESREAVTGWVFLVGVSLSILVAAGSPHSLEQVHRLIASTIIGATRGDVFLFGIMASITAAVVARSSQTLLLLVMDPEMARSVGTRVSLWNGIVWVWIGIAVSLSIRVAGMTYTFACLVLPPLIAKNVCREAGQIFVLAPVVALATGLCGFVLANYYDYPPGQTVTAVQCAALLLVWLPRR